jgi:hypothetical protein
MAGGAWYLSVLLSLLLPFFFCCCRGVAVVTSLPPSGRAFCLASCCRLALMLTLVAAASWCLRQAHNEVASQQAYALDMARVAVVPPRTPPPLGQDSIDAALVMFGVDVPESAGHPRYDRELRDRGLTVRGAFMEKSIVTIGPAAFTSWSLLGSTLAHELEVHCRQNFLFITVMDALRLDGTGEAERQAYIHELRNARRFALPIADAELIANTMEYYYPDTVDARAPAPVSSVKRWLARNFLRGDRPL